MDMNLTLFNYFGSIVAQQLNLTQMPPIETFNGLMEYGAIGLFAMVLLYFLIYFIRKDSANSKDIKNFVEKMQIDNKAIHSEKSDLNKSFISHIQGNEGKFLTIIQNNSEAFMELSSILDRIKDNLQDISNKVSK